MEGACRGEGLVMDEGADITQVDVKWTAEALDVSPITVRHN